MEDAFFVPFIRSCYNYRVIPGTVVIPRGISIQTNRLNSISLQPNMAALIKSTWSIYPSILIGLIH